MRELMFQVWPDGTGYRWVIFTLAMTYFIYSQTTFALRDDAERDAKRFLKRLA